MSLPPAPFIVGVGRSGTTLLRLMLDSHPLLAIPPETGFLPAAADLSATVDLRDRFFAVLRRCDAWADFDLDPDALRGALDRVEPFDLAEGVRTFYRLYAARFGKPRWGDKTPDYGLHLLRIRRLIPEARFIHILRDGRDVALSIRPLWFAPGRTLRDLAAHWQSRILEIRKQGAECGAYLELRYEMLVRSPERELRRACDFLELPYTHELLDYHRRAPDRLREHRTRYTPDGGVLITGEQRFHNQRFTTRPPDPSRVFRWKSEMSAAEREEFARAAGEFLQELGYEP